MLLTCPNELESFSENTEKKSNLTELKTTAQNGENSNQDTDWQDETEMESNDEQFDEEPESESRDFSQNQVLLTFSWSLMNQIRYLARTEGIGVEDLLSELVAEGVTKRAFEDQNKPAPSHLMTRNGYVHNTADGNTGLQQPQMSHHAMNNNRAPNNGQANRNKPNGQSRNNQYSNTARYQNPNGRNNQQGNNNRNHHNSQNNALSFRQNGGSYNSQQRYAPRPSSNTTNSNQTNTQTNHTQRPQNENYDNPPPASPRNNRKY